MQNQKRIGNPLLGFSAYALWVLDGVTYVLFVVFGLLIPFTVGVSAVFLPIPLVLWLLSWLGFFALCKRSELSGKALDRAQKGLKFHHTCFLIFKKVLPIVLCVFGGLIAVGAILGLVLRYFVVK